MRAQSAMIRDAPSMRRSVTSRIFRSALWVVRSLLPAAVSLMSLMALAQNPLVLSDDKANFEAWPAASILRDPAGKLTTDEALAAAEKFTPPKSAYATLGLGEKVVWLRIPVKVSSSVSPTNSQWILDIDYALLNRIDVDVAHDGKVVQHAELGNAQPFAQRPMHSRSHAVSLNLSPGMEYTLLLRVETVGAMILPITLSRLSAFHSRAINEQILQGMLVCLGLCLLFYSLLQWVSLREPLYLKYSLQIVGSMFFTIHFFGIGELYLWTDNMWFERHMAGITTLIAVCGTALFVEDALGLDMSRRLRLAMKTIACVLGNL